MIDCILNFIIEHWMILIPCLLGIIEFFLLLIFKKRPEVISNDLASQIIAQCHAAEYKIGRGNGELKLKMVLDYFKSKLGDNFQFFEPYIKNLIGIILECQSK